MEKHMPLRMRSHWIISVAPLVLFVAFLFPADVARGGQFSQCPPIGYATGCSFLITVQPNLKQTIGADPSVVAYDNIEDTLVGVQNNSGSMIFGIFLSGSRIFGFDGDGAGDPTGSFWGPGSPFGPFLGGPFGPTTYEGPNTSFTVQDSNSGVVNFFHRDATTGQVLPGLPAGRSLWFSLEGSPNSIAFRKFVAIDPGHGRRCDQPNSPPTGATDASKSDSEDDFVLDIGNHVTAFLTSLGHRVLQTRTTPCFMTLQERVHLANNAGTDLFVSVHLNASINPTIHGTEVLIKDQARLDELRLAQLIFGQQQGLGLSQFSTGIEARPDLYVLRKTDMTAALTEVAFISNSTPASGQTITDEQRLDDPTFRVQAASAVANAINQFFIP